MGRYIFRLAPSWLKKEVSTNVGNPKRSLVGRLTKEIFVYLNTHLEMNAVRLCKIQPSDKVLEVGFGPGVGLKAAYPKVKDGQGIVYGIDMSEFMMDVAKKRVKTGIDQGKIVLFHGCASAIPLDTNSIDHIFHCNCFYFWLEPHKVICELHRVLKPGSRMLCTISPHNIKIALENGIITPDQCDTAMHMKHLEQGGFENIQVDNYRTPLFRWPYQAITATAKK